jgi:hypothetical protein
VVSDAFIDQLALPQNICCRPVGDMRDDDGSRISAVTVKFRRITETRVDVGSWGAASGEVDYLSGPTVLTVGEVVECCSARGSPEATDQY